MTDSADVSYSKVRFIADCPSFMGVDLEEYGPFDEGNEAEVPEDNAEILVNRGTAEEIEDKDEGLEPGDQIWP